MNSLCPQANGSLADTSADQVQPFGISQDPSLTLNVFTCYIRHCCLRSTDLRQIPSTNTSLAYMLQQDKTPCLLYTVL